MQASEKPRCPQNPSSRALQGEVTFEDVCLFKQFFRILDNSFVDILPCHIFLDNPC